MIGSNLANLWNEPHPPRVKVPMNEAEVAVCSATASVLGKDGGLPEAQPGVLTTWSWMPREKMCNTCVIPDLNEV